MRWLLIKDLQILRRSPLQAVLLVVYPVLIAILVGFAISRSPEKPRVAFLNEVPRDTQVSVGGDSLDVVNARDRLCERLECVRVRSRQEAIDKVESGDVLGALILPSDLAERINSLASLNPNQPEVEVIVNEEDPVKARFVDDRISSLLSEANLLIARRVARTGGDYLGLILNGGHLSFLGQSFDILGLRASARVLEALRPDIPRGPMRSSLDEVLRFTTLARDNLNLAGPLLNAVAEPIKVQKTAINGSSPPLDTFAIAVSATVTLMFVTVLLVAGSLALEREENAFARLTRGLVGESALLSEKVALGIVVSLLVTLLMLAGLEPFVSLDWGRFGIWIVAILAGGAAFAAAGAALGAAAREVRAASLLAFMVSLPIAFLSLVPSGSVSPGLYDVISVITALFPFKPALHAMTTALDASGPSLGTALIHLGVLVLAYAVIARLALRRFASI
jgi:ABC-type transport system involved in cytochrome c biogenesis permease component